MFKVSQYNHNLVQNIITTLLVAMSPRTPRASRKSPIKLYSYNRENARRARFNNVISR